MSRSADNETGGTGAGSIGAVNIGGNAVSSIIAAGLTNPNGMFKDNDDAIFGAAQLDKLKNTIAALIMKGTTDPDSYFVADKFNSKPKINNATITLPDARYLVA
jgi:hypothetical protein